MQTPITGRATITKVHPALVGHAHKETRQLVMLRSRDILARRDTSAFTHPAPVQGYQNGDVLATARELDPRVEAGTAAPHLCSMTVRPVC